MRLERFRVANYKIVGDTGWVNANEWVTSLVGKNESGKSAILKALWKSKSAAAKFDKLTDFPRDRYTAESKGNQLITALEFKLTAEESAQLGALIPEYSGADPELVTVNTYFEGEEEIYQQVEFPQLTASIRRGQEALQVVDAVVAGLMIVGGADRPAFEAAVKQAREQINPEKALWKKPNAQLLQAVKQAADKLDVAPEQAVAQRALLADTIAVASGGDLTEAATKWVLDNMPGFIYFSDYGQLRTKINLPAFISDAPEATSLSQTTVDRAHLVAAAINARFT